MATRMQHCFNCGAQVGVFQAWPGDVIDCGKRECASEAQATCRERDEDAMERAREDDFDRYR
jgi:hypothetical protein